MRIDDAPRAIREIARRSSALPVRFEGAPDGPLANVAQWRAIRNLDDHGEMCRAFGLDPVRFYFDLPSTARGIGSNTGRARGGTIDGFVFLAGYPLGPVAKIRVCFESERLWDSDPESRRDFEDLGHR